MALEAEQNAIKGSSACGVRQSEENVPPRKGGKNSIRFFNHCLILKSLKKLEIIVRFLRIGNFESVFLPQVFEGGGGHMKGEW